MEFSNRNSKKVFVKSTALNRKWQRFVFEFGVRGYFAEESVRKCEGQTGDGGYVLCSGLHVSGPRGFSDLKDLGFCSNDLKGDLSGRGVRCFSIWVPLVFMFCVPSTVHIYVAVLFDPVV